MGLNKKISVYFIYLLIFVFLIILIGNASLLRHHFKGGKKLQSLQDISIYISTIPSLLHKMYRTRSIDLNKLDILTKHKNKESFRQFVKKNRNAILILPIYDHALSRSRVDIIDLMNFKKIHSYSIDIKKLNSKLKEIKNLSNINVDFAPSRFLYQHPLLLQDGSLITQSNDYPVFKLDFCSNLVWINTDEVSHHSLEEDHEGNIWTGGTMNEKSNYIKKFNIEDFEDDSIIKFDKNGKVLFTKSVIEILIENQILPDNFGFNSYRSNETDPIHLNDIEPALFDSEYWKLGDVFLSLRAQSSIVHYRPTANKVINYITGPFSWQHDVDIISDKEISIFDNNNSAIDNEYSKIMIYNFKNRKFKTLFNNELQKENFKTETQGLSHIFNDGALMVEEQNHGRIILLNNQGQKEWEFVNKDINGNIGFTSWSRIIEDEEFINSYKLMLQSNKCSS